MENLSQLELLNIDGGTQKPPVVSSDGSVQTGYSIGWHIGHAIGNTVQQIGEVLSHVNPFDWK